METRKCMHCSKAIAADKRADTKFCSNSCKANYWEANKGKTVVPVVISLPQKDKPQVAGQPLEGLRGVLGNKQEIAVRDVRETFSRIENQTLTPIPVQRETQAYKDALALVEEADAYYKKGKGIYANCNTFLEDWQNENELMERQKIKIKAQLRPANIDAIAILERLGDKKLHGQLQAVLARQNEARKRIADLMNSKAEVVVLTLDAKKKLDAAQLKLKSIPQYETVKPAIALQPPTAITNTSHAPLPIQLAGEEPEKGYKEERTESSITIQTNSKLMSSRELRGMNYKCLNFQGRWKEFFGLPAVIFHLAVHGKPGEGKSTFCIQLADYLAQNFGEVVYISGEEGFSKTLRDKVVNNKIDNPHLFFADINTLDEITTEIESNKFHFIFIDSLDTLRIDAAKLHELREHYPQSTFVTISQSTKDGKMRGSQEIIHDADITVKVEDGIAETTKNRFHPRGTQFRVFPTEKAAAKVLSEPKNII